MLDHNGFRLNVGIVLVNAEGKLFWGERIRAGGWQFPQGGVDNYESLEEAMYRELHEEVGLVPEDVSIIAVTRRWCYYRLPTYMRRNNKRRPCCVGQKQKWFLLKLMSSENHINLTATEKPEFCSWKWVDYWEPLSEVIYFKRGVYSKVLRELEPYIKQLQLKVGE